MQNVSENPQNNVDQNLTQLQSVLKEWSNILKVPALAILLILLLQNAPTAFAQDEAPVNGGGAPRLTNLAEFRQIVSENANDLGLGDEISYTLQVSPTTAGQVLELLATIDSRTYLAPTGEVQFSDNLTGTVTTGADGKIRVTAKTVESTTQAGEVTVGLQAVKPTGSPQVIDTDIVLNGTDKIELPPQVKFGVHANVDGTIYVSGEAITANVGESSTLTFTVENNGSDAAPLSAEVLFPSGVEILGGKGATGNVAGRVTTAELSEPRTFVWQSDRAIQPGEKTSFSVRFAATEVGSLGQIVFNVESLYPELATDTNSKNDRGEVGLTGLQQTFLPIIGK